MVLQLSARRPQYPENNLIYINLLSFRITFPKQGVKAIKHSTGSMRVTNHPVQSCPYLFKFGWGLPKKSQGRAAVYCDCGQRLPHFMSNRSRNRLRVHKFIVSFALQHGV